MLGWFKAEAARASRRKRSSACGVSRQFIRQEFQRDKAPKRGVFGLVDNSLAPAAEFLENAVVHLLKKAKILAARRETSISGLLAKEIEFLVGEEEVYERAERQAIALLDKGFRMGGVIRAGRDELHER
jgi:hypothetical protein